MSLLFETVIDLSTRDAENCTAARSPSETLEDFFGYCAVIDVHSNAGEISAAEVTNAVESITRELQTLDEQYGSDSFSITRFLFKTKSNDDDAGRFFSTEALLVLSKIKAQLVGTDMPELTARADSSEGDMKNIEFSILTNLSLQGVESGHHYQLMAPPLVVRADGNSPVRAVLVS